MRRGQGHTLVEPCQTREAAGRSAGLLALGTARERMTALHGHLALCGLTAAVRIACEPAGLTGQFLIETSREEALRRIHGEVAR
jgi:anti-anti-sigma regulatory factor